MADQDVQANVEPAVINIPPSGSSSQNVITLKDTDIQTIADILRETFAPQLTEMVNTIVSGVVEGLNLTTQSLEKENRGLKAVGIKCEKSRHERKDAKRCEKSGKDAKRAVLWKKKTGSAI